LNLIWSIEDAASRDIRNPVTFVRRRQSGLDAICSVETEITHALMRCVRELMDIHRTAWPASDSSDLSATETDC
jgi:hypothetical protein